MSLSGKLERPGIAFVDRVGEIDWGLVALVGVIAGIGVAMLYSAGGGAVDPWCRRQAIRIAVFTPLMLAAAVVGLRFWMRRAYAVYALSLALVIAVEIAGATGMGAQRWIDLHVFRLQPSEPMKIALVLALAAISTASTRKTWGAP